MTDFADYDPEDAYDAGDPPELRLAVLRRVVAALRQRDAHHRDGRRGDALRLLANLERDEPGLDRLELESLRSELAL